MYNYSYYPSTSKEFVIGAVWQPWKKITKRKTPVSRVLKKPVILKKEKFNKSLPSAYKKNFKEVNNEDVNVTKFNIFGSGRLGLSVTKLVRLEPSPGARSGCLRKNSDKLSVFGSNNKFLRYRKSSV